MDFKVVTTEAGSHVGYIPVSTDKVVQPEVQQTVTHKTFEQCGEANGLLDSLTPELKPGIWAWSLAGNGSPTDSLINGQSCTLLITAGTYSITWPTSTVIGTWPAGLDAGVNVIVLFKRGGVLYRHYAGVAA